MAPRGATTTAGFPDRSLDRTPDRPVAFSFCLDSVSSGWMMSHGGKSKGHFSSPRKKERSLKASSASFREGVIKKDGFSYISEKE